MQTFVPELSYSYIAMSLDDKRLFKQAVETKQIYLSLTVDEYGWKNHPAVKMWAGCEEQLLLYGWEMIVHAVSIRNFNSPVLFPWYEERISVLRQFSDSDYPMPFWWGDNRVHASHRAMLFRKDPDHYQQYVTEGEAISEYFWPTDNVARIASVGAD